MKTNEREMLDLIFLFVFIPGHKHFLYTAPSKDRDQERGFERAAPFSDVQLFLNYKHKLTQIKYALYI